MKTSVGRTALEIVPGDITELAVDAITNPASTDLHMDAGVAGAIKRAGGEAIETEAVLQGPIEVGKAVATTGHDLKAHWVIHAALMGPDLTTDANAIAKATRSALETAERVHARSIALPAFGTGVGGFPVYQCASIMVGECVRYLRERPKNGLRQIIFSTHGDAARAAFKNALAGSSRFAG
jgi:O-acetyl-ADP-ribose deacetylase (regulator of RNase III)